MVGERRMRDIALRLGFRLERRRHFPNTGHRDGSLYGVDLTKMAGAVFFRVVEEDRERIVVARCLASRGHMARIRLFAHECGLERIVEGEWGFRMPARRA